MSPRGAPSHTENGWFGEVAADGDVLRRIVQADAISWREAGR